MGSATGAARGARTAKATTAFLVRAHDAPGPTLVLRLDHLPLGALALGGELAGLRQALAGTPYAGIGKIALYGSAGGDRLDYRFVQALPDGGFDFRAGCGHSLLACVVADGRPGPVTVRAVTTGDTVLCEHEREPDEGAYTLSFLRAPTAPGTFPTGHPVDVLDGIPVSLVRYGNPYVFVDVRHLPEEKLRERLEGLRAHAARLLGHPPHSALPKIAAFTAGPGGIAVRALTVGGWHPRLALTGAAALAAAGALDGTVVPPVDGEVRTPGGTVTVSTGPDRVRVHHKRAELLERLVLPWRIHATA
ncbi:MULTISPECIES: 2-methylaconitate cis-trans isomerase PrpF family protein [unclassified Streptomyces]|uniref:2-methylaconitate cis-trans isomerase PrpF family protein n=1 Tax=unclassified Streptomyces TaxID=2593676 RepID=UPI001E36850F|nr:2-methylaconitate cis-trans isomerase PrpF family protein [Streptomyces sp. CB02980]MCB8907295.1 2-methylaconitate cis-trans isomerase PrpF family protein [Streptomyces sp. CB02980]